VLELARRLLPAGAVAELLPGPRSGREPEGDGPNSPWFDWRRARGADGSEPEAEDEFEGELAPADERGAENEREPAEMAGTDSASTAPRMFPWFGF
jgi:hypothetical protein